MIDSSGQTLFSVQFLLVTKSPITTLLPQLCDGVQTNRQKKQSVRHLVENAN